MFYRVTSDPLKLVLKVHTVMKADFSEKVLLDTVHKTKVQTTELGIRRTIKRLQSKVSCCVNMLHVDDPRELLHSVEQEIAFLYGFLILPVLTVRPVEREKARDVLVSSTTGC